MNSQNKKSKTKLKNLVSNQLSTGSTSTKRGRAKKKPAAPTFQGVPRLPAIFRAVGDVIAMRLRCSYAMHNRATGVANRLFVLAPESFTTPGYLGLTDLFPLLGGMAAQYSRFMVGRVSAQVIPVSPVTESGYVALGYEPTDSAVSVPPTTLGDTTSSVHSDVAQVTEIAGITFDASDYFNDWRVVDPSVGDATAQSQAGVIQVLCANIQAVDKNVAILQLEVDVHFCGFRRG